MTEIKNKILDQLNISVKIFGVLHNTKLLCYNESFELHFELDKIIKITNLQLNLTLNMKVSIPTCIKWLSPLNGILGWTKL